MDNFVITIARQYGSGGRTVGEMLAKKLGIGYYDKDIIRMASEDSGIHETLFGRVDEYSSAKKPLFGKNGIYSGELISPQSKDFTSDENLFNYQAKIIRELAGKESCVIIGRCADYVLREQPGVTSVFIYADMNDRIRRLMETRKITRDEAITLIKKTDKSRRNYYECYTGKRWGAGASYDVTLNSAELGLDTCVDLICHLYDRKQEGESED